MVRSTMEEARKAERGNRTGPQADPAPQPWESPIPLPGLPPVPPFPLDAIPSELAEYVRDVAGTTNTPPDYPACFALAIAAGAAGATQAISIKAGHVQRASLYLCAVAPKGSGKSPALDAVAEPVYDEQARLRRYGEKKRKAFVADVTVEKLAELLSDNARGVLMIRDELAGWMLSFNQYKAGGKGGDRQFYLTAWSGSPVSVDRKNKDAEPIYVRFPCLTVVGTIQPSVFDRFKADADDGFYDRVLFCFPDELPLSGEQWKTIDSVRAEDWSVALAVLRDQRMVDDEKNGLRPEFLHLDPDARARWQGWTQSVADEVNRPEFDPAMRGPAVKLSGYAARLALISHLLRKGYKKPVSYEPGTGREVIDGQDMERGVNLACYFLEHAKRAWAAVGLDGQYTATRRLLRWVQSGTGEPFSRRDAHRALQRVFPSSESLGEPLRVLVQHGYLRHQAAGADKLSGQNQAAGPKSVIYEVNPEICQRVSAVSASALQTNGDSVSR